MSEQPTNQIKPVVKGKNVKRLINVDIIFLQLNWTAKNQMRLNISLLIFIFILVQGSSLIYK
jgi:hypothetical protein